VFVVGDEKQSIYRFRGADVTVFNACGRRSAGPAARDELPLAPAVLAS
jgi:ATP-dependent exoDNAse (exonuclease V) beta subunit